MIRINLETYVSSPRYCECIVGYSIHRRTNASLNTLLIKKIDSVFLMMRSVYSASLKQKLAENIFYCQVWGEDVTSGGKISIDLLKIAFKILSSNFTQLPSSYNTRERFQGVNCQGYCVVLKENVVKIKIIY